MHFLPHLYETVDYKVKVDRQDIDEFSAMVVEDISKEFADEVMNGHGLAPLHRYLGRCMNYA